MMLSLTAKSLADGQSMMPELPRSSRPIPRIIWDGKPEGLFSPFATLLVDNSTNGGIILTTGRNPMTNQNGTQMINPGVETYELNLQKQSEYTISNLKVDVRTGVENFMDIPEFKFLAEHTYRVKIERGVQPRIELVGKSDTSSMELNLTNE
jgi:hypothetical protein